MAVDNVAMLRCGGQNVRLAWQVDRCSIGVQGRRRQGKARQRRVKWGTLLESTYLQGRQGTLLPPRYTCNKHIRYWWRYMSKHIKYRYWPRYTCKKHIKYRYRCRYR